MKRFYDKAAARQGKEGWRILLDERPVKTPAKASLVLPTAPLAEAVAGEWNAASEEIDPTAMPLTGLANAAIDRVAPAPDIIATEIASYGETDLLCYRAETPEVLRARQDEAWQPVLDWAERALEARLNVTSGILPATQDPQAMENLRQHLLSLDAFALTAVMKLAQGTGSVMLSVAVANDRLGAEEAFDLSLVDEIYQEEAWGEDDEALARRALIRGEMAAAGLFLRLLRA